MNSDLWKSVLRKALYLYYTRMSALKNVGLIVAQNGIYVGRAPLDLDMGAVSNTENQTKHERAKYQRKYPTKLSTSQRIVTRYWTENTSFGIRISIALLLLSGHFDSYQDHIAIPDSAHHFRKIIPMIRNEARFITEDNFLSVYTDELFTFISKWPPNITNQAMEIMSLTIAWSKFQDEI